MELSRISLVLVLVGIIIELLIFLLKRGLVLIWIIYVQTILYQPFLFALISF